MPAKTPDYSVFMVIESSGMAFADCLVEANGIILEEQNDRMRRLLLVCAFLVSLAGSALAQSSGRERIERSVRNTRLNS